MTRSLIIALPDNEAVATTTGPNAQPSESRTWATAPAGSRSPTTLS